jgi:hypothetical protein
LREVSLAKKISQPFTRRYLDMLAALAKEKLIVKDQESKKYTLAEE